MHGHRDRQPERDHVARGRRRCTAATWRSTATPWARPRMNVSGCGLAEREGAHEQRQVDDRVDERRHLQAPEGDEAHHPAAVVTAARRAGAAARRPRSGQRSTSAGHHAKSSCSASGVTAAPSGSQASPTSDDQPAGQLDQRLDRQPLGRDRPLLVELAHERLGRVLADLDRARRRPAPSARPTSPARRRAARPASGRRPARTTHIADRLCAAPSASRRSAQRAGCSSSVQRRRCRRSKPASRAARPSWLGEPRSRSSASDAGRPPRSPPAARA